jgi:FdhE protein
MISSTWDQRIARAAELSGEVECAAADFLRFYALVARVQQHTYENLPVPLLALDGPPLERLKRPENLELLRSHLLDLLSLVREHGPATLAQRADEIAHSDAERLTSVVSNFWRPEQDALDHFFARVVLQSAAERLAEGFDFPAGYDGQVCPFCSSEPLLAVLRPENLGAKRSLLCSLCATEWAFPRALCPVCGEDRNDRLSVYTPDNAKHVRIDACETCKIYIKTVDLSQLGTAVPIVDDIASLPLSLWATEHGYKPTTTNLFGM